MLSVQFDPVYYVLYDKIFVPDLELIVDKFILVENIVVNY